LDNRDHRLKYARHGLAYAQYARKLNPRRVEPYYYEALNLAKMAEVKSRLKMVPTMIAAARKAAEIDEGYANAGPLVFQGKVYLTAPPWPMSVGNVEKAVELLDRAVKIAPIPLNRVFLGEAYYQDEQYNEAKVQIEKALREAGPFDLAPHWRSEAEECLIQINTALRTGW
ncbi:MAG: hypothetical protein V1754_03120, partial [Pseudomonadota bacterium]